jgi:uncharacterized protein (DUF427 family)
MGQTEALEDRILVGIERPPHLAALRIERAERRIRGSFAGQLVVDSQHALLVFEPRRLPVYYFPASDVRMELLKPTQHTVVSGADSATVRWDLEFEGRVAENAAWGFRDPDGERAALRDHVAFYWNQMDSWFEEDDEVFVHPRDPYHRVDVLNSSRHVKVVVEGEVVAETHRPRLLFETGLPTRYYFPKLDVRLEVLEPTDSVTACPYKGQARYWSVRVGDRVLKDLVWSYPTTIPECPKIENLLSFYNEKVDLYVDGELQARPVTPWS